MSKSRTTIDKLIPPVHPGDALADILEDNGISATRAAAAMRVPTNRLTLILKRERAVTADTAMRLARYFGTSAELWMNLQSRYDLLMAERESGARVAAQVRPLKKSA